MKITVLAGGTSTERDISIVTGTKVAQALRSRGHEVALVDVFCGVEDLKETDAQLSFEALAKEDLEKTAACMHSFDDSLAKIRAHRKEHRLGFFWPMVLALCRYADIVFMTLHGSNG